MLEAGTDLLWEGGLALGAEHVTFTRVFSRLERDTGVRVTHAAVIRRIWRNQEEFQQDVLALLAASDQWNMDAQVLAQVRRTVADLGGSDLTDAEARRRAVSDFVRIGGARTLDVMTRSELWPRWIGTWALVNADAGSERKQPVFDALHTSLEEATRRDAEFFGAAFRSFGLRVRSPFTLRQFVLLLSAFTQGAGIRERLDGAMTERVDRPTGPNGEHEAWSLFTVGLAALAMALVERDPEWRGPAPQRTGRPGGESRSWRPHVPWVDEAGGNERRSGRGASRTGTATGRSGTSRRRRHELRDLVLRAGVELLLEEGLASGAAHVTFKRAFDHLEATCGVRLTNAAVIGRIWKNQADYQSDVVTSVASVRAEILQPTFEAAVPLFHAHGPSTTEQRWQTLVQLCRLGGAANVRTLGRSPRWQRWVGVWALSMVRTGGGDDGALVALRRGYDTAATDYERLLGAVYRRLGVRLRPGLSLRQLTVIAIAFAEGSALRLQGIERDAAVVRRPTGPNAEEEEWTLFGIGLEALVRAFLEPDPEWTAPSPEGADSPAEAGDRDLREVTASLSD